MENVRPDDIAYGADRFEIQLTDDMAAALGMRDEQEPEEHAKTQAVVTRLIEQAVRHYESELQGHQTESQDFYYGRPFGDEEEGRSKVVATVERDTIEAIMPSLLRIFLGPERPVEYRPRNVASLEEAREREAQAKQATDAISHTVREECDGYRLLMGAFDDAMGKRAGPVKFWWDERTTVSAEQVSGVDEAQLGMIMQEGAEVANVEPIEMFDVDETTGEPIQLYRATVTRKTKQGRLRVEGVPPEEFVYTPARRLDESLCVAHIREVYVSDLIAMGLDRDKVMAAAGDRHGHSNELRARRQHSGVDTAHDVEEGDPSTRKVTFCEAYALVDVDEDLIAERRMFQCVGPSYRVVNTGSDGLPGQIVDGLPFAVFSMRPLAHMITGLDVHDFLKDTQRIVSQVERGVLDSLAQSLEPITEVVEGRVNLDDLLSPDATKIVRVDQPGMMREVKHQFIGPEALPVLEYYQHRREEKMGVTKASQGLDADSLQSATKAAVAGTLAAAQQRIEMIARSLAETGMKELFRGLLRLFVQHQDRERVMKLRGQWVAVNPVGWQADMDVVVNVGLGTGSLDERRAALIAVAEDHAAQMQNNSPLVSWAEVRAVRAKLIELHGYPNPDEFYKPFGPEEEMQYAEQQAQNPPNDPAMALVQVEQMKAESQSQLKQMELQHAEQRMQIEHQQRMQELAAKAQIEREKMALDAELKRIELEMKYGAMVDDAMIKAITARVRAEIDAEARVEVAHAQAAIRSGGSE
jgi:hypothetical protein